MQSAAKLNFKAQGLSYTLTFLLVQSDKQEEVISEIVGSESASTSGKVQPQAHLIWTSPLGTLMGNI